MSFWRNIQTAAGSAGNFWVVLGFLVVALLLFGLRPASRPRARAAVLLLALALACLLASAALLSYGADAGGAGAAGAAYLWLSWCATFAECLAVINVTGVLLFDVALEGARLRPPRIMRDLLVALAYVVVAVALLARAGFNPTGIIATSALLTAVIGLSFQDTLGNTMGGLALQLEHSIRVGDWVRIDQQEGRIVDIRWRHTSIETRNWDTILIPNSVLMKSQVTVLGRRGGLTQPHRQWVYFNVDFRYAPTDVTDAVVTALLAEPIANVAREPPPQCIVADFLDSYARYAVRYWLTDLALTDPTDSVVRARIYFALRRAGIPLSIPARSLFITEEDEGRRTRKREEEVGRRCEALRSVELFRTLTDAERQELAGRLKVAPFARGEAMTRQGAVAHWLYVITSGEVEVRFTGEDGLSVKVAVLGSGDFFGEMGLMTGEPRTATVLARTDVECYRLDKESFDAVLQRRPEIAEDISHVLARRRAELEAVREGLSEEVMRQRMRRHQGDLLNRIRNFFSLG
ncbi:MAG TPA: mechanosensitive ion channel family protein [Pyrinomonadaceae bacterium]|jgi:small-conductance mechanosensitive channel/CRP-like cAMP-binding protein|nr:mechanosensitive ion channel family protein [Pyrinomonadaceae bacterium]